MGIIKSVNQKRPYIFISYANADSTQVFSDVRRLQEKGINIWIDEDLKRYIGSSWKKRVQGVMRNGNCKAIMFFVSKFSLASDAVKEELDMSRSEDIRGTHFGRRLAIIPIEVNHIGNIGRYCDQLANDYSLNDWESDLPNGEGYVPSKNIIYIRNNFFATNEIMAECLYDKDNLEDVLTAIGRFGLDADIKIGDSYAVQTKADDLFKQGKLFIKNRKWEDAIRCFDMSAIYGKADAYLELAHAYWEKRKLTKLEYKKMESCLMRAADYGNLNAHLDLIKLYISRNEYVNARRILNEIQEFRDYQYNINLRNKCSILSDEIKDKEHSAN